MMKRIFLIFALFLVACDDTIISDCENHGVRTASPLNPIELWAADCDSYNRKRVCGIFPKCFCLPWKCENPFKGQLKDTDFTKNYSIRILSEDGATLDEQEIPKIVMYSTIDMEDGLNFEGYEFEGGIGAWDQLTTGSFGTGQLFVWNNPSSARSDGSVSNLAETAAIGQDRTDANRPWPAGDYQVTIKAINTSAGGSAPLTQQLAVYGSDSELSVGSSIPYTGTGTWDVGAGDVIRTINFTLTSEKEFLWFEFFKQGSSSGYEVLFTIDYISLDSYPSTEQIPAEAVYTYDIDVNEYCGSKVSIEIFDTDTGELYWYSDCIDVSEDHTCLNDIEYSNNRNFAGITWVGGSSPDLTLKISIPSVFFEERYPEEDFAIETTAGIEKTSSVIKAQRLFKTDYLPYYLHKKLKMILMCHSVLIDGFYWTKEEAYEIIRSDNPKWPINMGQVFLTERDFVQRSVT